MLVTVGMQLNQLEEEVDGLRQAVVARQAALRPQIEKVQTKVPTWQACVRSPSSWLQRALSAPCGCSARAAMALLNDAPQGDTVDGGSEGPDDAPFYLAYPLTKLKRLCAVGGGSACSRDGTNARGRRRGAW